MDRPIVFITIAFSVGIVFGKYTYFPFWLIFSFLTIFFILSITTFIRKLDLSVFILIVCFLTGMLSFQVKNMVSANDISRFVEKGYLTVTGQITDQPQVKDKKISFPLKVERISRGQASVEASGVVYVSVQSEGDQLSYGERVKVRGVLSQFPSYSNPLLPEGLEGYHLRASFYKKLPGGGGNPFKKVALWLSQRFNKILLKILPQKEASLLGSVLLGSSVSPLSQETKEVYRKAGLIHLLVVSGTQVSILIGVCLAIARALGLPLWLSVVITSFFNFLLVVVTGAGPSILRAATMGEITLIGLLFEREKEFYTSLSLSALILLIANPSTLFDIGFQLSFAATWALVYIAPVLRDWLVSYFIINHELTRRTIPNLLAISLAPILATSPIIAFNFSQISLGAVVSNLLVLPWIEFLVILGFSTTLIGFVFLPLAMLLGNTIWLMLSFLEKIAEGVSSLPGACFYIKPPSLALIIGYYVGLIVLIEVLRKEGRIRLTGKRLVFTLFLLFSIFVWDRAFSSSPFANKELIVTFLDVGQGDCALIETPGGKKILVDGGGSEGRYLPAGRQGTKGDGQRTIDPIGEKVVVPFLRRKGINRLDMVILTHPHADHVGGLNSVLEKIKVKQVLDSGQIFKSEAYQRFKDLVRVNSIKYNLARAGQIIRFGKNLNGYILNPFYPLLGSINSDSVVMRLAYGKVSFLFTGDLENEGEERVLRSGINLRSTFLKVGHHGSSTSTSPEFLQAVNPQAAVISVGKRNRYRHPSFATLLRLKEAGVKIFRTDVNGAVVTRTDGERFSIAPQKW